MDSFSTENIRHQRNILMVMSLASILVIVIVAVVFYAGNRNNRDAGAQSSTTKYGLHMDLTYDGYQWRRTDHINSAKSVGAQISRNSLLWHQIEPIQGVKDWSRTDAVVNELTSNGIEPMFVLVGSPSWVNGTPGSTADYQFYIPTGTGAAFSSWSDAYAEFARQAAARYKNKVKKWEVWNEPNEHFAYKPAPSLDQYAILYTKVRSAILSQDSTAQIATGGLAGLCCNNAAAGDISGYSFLQGLIDRNVPIDNVAIHPYDSGSDAPDIDKQWDNNFTDTSRVRSIMVNAGLGNKPIWITEWGWTTANVSEATQAQYLQKSLEMIRDQYNYVTVAIYFVDVDRGSTYLHGLFKEDSPPVAKPSASVFANFIQSITPVPSPTPPPPSPIPTPNAPPPSTDVESPAVEVTGANKETPVTIPATLKPSADGSLVADFDGDGVNDIAKDVNNDGKIDPKTEIVSQLAELAGNPLSYESSGNVNNPNKNTLLIKYGASGVVRIPKLLGYSFLAVVAISLVGIVSYLSIIKFSYFSNFRHRLGL